MIGIRQWLFARRKGSAAMKIIKLLAVFAVAAMALAACAQEAAPTVPTTLTAPAITTACPTEPTEDAAITDGIHAGHRPDTVFSMTILLEGMEETVNARHISGGQGRYRMDYFWEDFDLREDTGSQAFLWKYTADTPVNSMCIRIDGTAGAAQLSQAALAGLEDAETADALAGNRRAIQISGYRDGICLTNYYFDIADGCVVIEMSCTVEALEGIGARMHAMLDTLEFLD